MVGTMNLLAPGSSLSRRAGEDGISTTKSSSRKHPVSLSLSTYLPLVAERSRRGRGKESMGIVHHNKIK